MKRTEQLTWAAFAGLVVIFLILLSGGIVYHVTVFWVGAMLCAGQSIVLLLAAWGLKLAREYQELVEPIPGSSNQPASTFRMSAGDENIISTAPITPESEVKTLDTGFQRLLTIIAASILILLGGGAIWIIITVYRWASTNPDLPVPVAGTFDKALYGIDELGLVIGLASAGIYVFLWWINRPKRDTFIYGDPANSTLTIGITGMAALGVASILAYLKVAWASEVAAIILTALILLQGLELIVNGLRSYSDLDELDQDAVDLQALPLVPMLGSTWLSGLHLLFAQSVGLSRKDEPSVIGRIMPRAIIAIILIAIFGSCIRVVRPGEVAILERLGYVPVEPNDPANRPTVSAILQPGMHLTFPWPIDTLVRIPRDQLQLTDVGTELHAPKEFKSVDFQFWTIREDKPEGEANDEFVTGDPGSPQLLETYIQVRWRVKDPGLFYNALSHSDFYEKSAESTKALPIYEAIIQQCTDYAVTKAFATHSLDHIMIENRPEVELHCQKILQEKLDSLIRTPAGTPAGCGIEVVYLTIKDLHPPFWKPEREDPTAPEIAGIKRFRGPAAAFEFVVTMSEFYHMAIARQEAENVAKLNIAKGDAAVDIARAQSYSQDLIARAEADAGRFVNMTHFLSSQTSNPRDRVFQLDLLEQQLKYNALNGLYDPVNKVVVDPRIHVNIWQNTPNGAIPFRPPG
jgi:regulator of protease activity HflC (stomatin/prohibitin superfamily)